MRPLTLILAVLLGAGTVMAKNIDETPAFSIAPSFFSQPRVRLSSTRSADHALKLSTAYLCYQNENGAATFITNENGASSASFTVATSTGIDAATSTAAPHVIEIYNAAGVLVDCQYATQPDLFHLAAGLYIVREGGVSHKILKK